MLTFNVNGTIDPSFLDTEESKSDFDLTEIAENSGHMTSLFVAGTVTPSQSPAPRYFTEKKGFGDMIGKNNAETIVNGANTVESVNQMLEYSKIEKDHANLDDTSSLSSATSQDESDEQVNTGTCNEQDMFADQQQKAQFRAAYIAGFRAAISESPILFVNQANNSVLRTSRPVLVQPSSDSSVGSNGGGMIEVACSQRAPGSVAFPRKLMDMLMREDPSVVSFLPSGKSFLIKDQDIFISIILPKYFRHANWTSFQRQLNHYGFRRITKGPEAGAYHHSLFHRDQPDMCRTMRRTKQKNSMELNNPSTAPSGSSRTGGRIWQRSRSESCFYNPSCASAMQGADSIFKLETGKAPINKGLSLLLNNPNLSATRSSLTARLLGMRPVDALPTVRANETKVARWITIEAGSFKR